MSCSHCSSPGPRREPVPVGIRTRTAAAPSVLLVGNPNAGKSTLFNAVTGARQDVRNAPGTTVEVSQGRWERPGGGHLDLIDTPGTYSLLARSQDEQVVVDLLSGTAGRPDLVVAVLDATAMSRSLYLLGQLSRTGLPMIVALSMVDVARAEGDDINPERLAEIVGVPVVVIDPRHRTGLTELSATIETALHTRPFLLGPDSVTCYCTGGCGECGTCEKPAARAEADGEPTLADSLADADAIFTWVELVTSRLGMDAAPARTTLSDKMDRWLLHPIIGIPVLLAIMWALFQLATSVAAPVMAWAESFVAGPVNGSVTWLLEAVGLDGTWLESLLIDGVFAGIGVVLSFVPLMFIMFLAIALLEDCGYLARAALLADRLMRSIGLDGRAVLPLIVGFGCNVPALAATRTLPNSRHRLVTALLVPLTSCAARMTVYILIAAAFFPNHAGTVVFLMYVASIVLIVLVGLALRVVVRDRTGAGRDPLFLVLPAYQPPRILTLVASAGQRAFAFLKGAGLTIIIMLTVVWGLMAIPVSGDHAIGDVPVEDSLYARTADAVSPVFAPAGFDEWRPTAALITGFVAKETVVAALAQSYAVDEPAENSYDDAEGSELAHRLRADFDASSGGHGGAAALAFLVFVLAYTPCVATLAEQKRMLGWKVTGIALGAQLVLAWMLAVGVFQVGKLF